MSDSSSNSPSTNGSQERSTGSAAQAQDQWWRRGLYQPQPAGWRDVLFALLIGAFYTLLLLNTVDHLGYARDEGFYFSAARTYERWFELLWSDPTTAFDKVDSFWRANNEHPALVKSLFALSHHFTFKRWEWFAMEGTSFRFPAMVLSSLAVSLVYLWGARAAGRLAGVVAAVSLAAMPRFFFHAHLACFDAPVMAMWTLCAYTYWRSLQRGGWWWPLAVGITFGLALNTKHNSWFLPIVFTVHAVAMQLLYTLQRLGRGRWGIATGWLAAGWNAPRKTMLRRSLMSLSGMVIVGPLVFYALWPWIWHDTLPRLAAYAKFHLHHVYYNMEYFGANYWQPPMPRSYAFVMTAVTVPAVTLLLFVLGMVHVGRLELAVIWRGVRRWVANLRTHEGATNPADEAEGDHDSGDDDSSATAGDEQALVASPTVWLWFMAMGVQYAAWLSPTTPIFGGTKHWMTAYPFLVLFAGVGLVAAVRAARRFWFTRRQGIPAWRQRLGRGSALEWGFAGAVLVAPVVETAHIHPWGLSSYSPLVGGAAGGATLGFNRGFWGYTTGSVAGYLNTTAPRRAGVYLHDTAGSSWDMLIRDGRIRRDIRGVWTVAGADFGLYHHEKHMSGVEYQNWVAFDTTAPDHLAGLDGVPVIWVYRHPRLKKR